MTDKEEVRIDRNRPLRSWIHLAAPGRGRVGNHRRPDGLGGKRLRRVAIPVTRPVIASFGVISFLSAWNQYTWPRAIVTEERWETIQIGLRSLSARTVDETNLGVAGALVAAAPVLLLLVVLQRHVVRGLTAGAVKG